MLPNCSEAKTPTPPSHSAQSSRERKTCSGPPKKMSQTLGNAASRFLFLFCCFLYHSLVCYLNFDGIVHTSNRTPPPIAGCFAVQRDADAEYSSLPSNCRSIAVRPALASIDPFDGTRIWHFIIAGQKTPHCGLC